MVPSVISNLDPRLKKFPLKSRQPFKGAYVAYRISALTFLLPFWAVYYSVTPRPRKSWTIKESVGIRLIRWIMPLNAECGLHPLSTDKTKEPPAGQLKETSFVWLDPAEESLIRGIAVDDKIKPVKVPGYIWPKDTPLEQGDDLIGLWIHGGGYMMGNGTESFGESEIPRALLKHSRIKNILSVEYRLVHEGCHPAQLLDALAAYSHLVKTLGIQPSRIVLIGACAGGNLVPLLARYLYEEKVLSMPLAMMLFSPCLDWVIDLEIAQGVTTPRPNTSIDMLCTSHLANFRLLGHNSPSLLETPYLSPNRAPAGSYTGYPLTFISIGGAESLEQECKQLTQLMKDDGVDVVLDIQPDASHDFLGIPIIPSDKARKQLVENACGWIEKLGRGK